MEDQPLDTFRCFEVIQWCYDLFYTNMKIIRPFLTSDNCAMRIINQKVLKYMTSEYSRENFQNILAIWHKTRLFIEEICSYTWSAIARNSVYIKNKKKALRAYDPEIPYLVKCKWGEGALYFHKPSWWFSDTLKLGKRQAWAFSGWTSWRGLLHLFFVFFVFLPFLGPLSRHVEVARLAVESEL